MIALKEITLDLKERYDRMLGEIPTSFYRFSNIFMARDCSHLKYAEIDDAFCLMALPPDDPEDAYGFFPLNAEESRLRHAFTAMREELGIRRFYVPAQVLPQIEAECPEMFSMEASRGDFDYVYHTQDLIQLPGKKYHAKRNHLSKFVSTYAYEYVPIDGGNFDQCRPMMDAWFAQHTDVNTEFFDEEQVINALIANFDALELRAGALKVNGNICAFSIGELTAPDTAHIIIEKADIQYTGAYAAINREFLANAWSETTYVNREEDMGHEGLRKAKESYHPIRFNEVYKLTFRQEALK